MRTVGSWWCLYVYAPMRQGVSLVTNVRHLACIKRVKVDSDSRSRVVADSLVASGINMKEFAMIKA